MLEPGEKEMIAGVMRLGDLPVGAVMTPRHEVAMIDLADDINDIYAELAGSTHSRFAVFDGDRDSAIGIDQAKGPARCLSRRPDAGHPRFGARSAGDP